MKHKHFAGVLTAVVTVFLAFSLSANAAPQAVDNAQEKVERIIAVQKAELESESEIRAKSKTYPFFTRFQSPGMRTVEGVEQRTVLEGSIPGEQPEDYNNRVVTFAPRKGVDYVEVDPRMPLWEWTFTEAAFARNVIPAVFQNDNRKLKAHLVGFSAIGYTIDEGEFKGEIDIPCLLLRLPDGRIRMVETRYLGADDLRFAATYHRAALDDIKTNRIPEQPRVLPAQVTKNYPNPTEPGVKNSHFLTESDFTVLVSGTEHPEPGNANHWVTWVNSMGDRKAGRKVRTKTCAWFDAHWLIFDYAGFYMPGIDAPEPRTKFWWFVGGPTIDGKGTKGGGGGNHIGNGSPGIAAHEWGHMTRFLNPVRHGGGETWADTLQDTAFGTGTGGRELNTPHQHIFSAGNRYAYTHFYTTVGEDPSLGYLWYARLPVYDERQQPSADSALHLIAELFKRQQLTEYADQQMVNEPVKEFGDLFGEYAARTATFDNQKEYLYHNSRYSPPRQGLELLDRERNIWRVPTDSAPQAQGFNVVRLVPEKGAGQIEVDFIGIHDPSIYSDWRVCIVAVETDGRRRYSNLWNRGTVTFPVKADDRSIWLTVAATPTALKKTDGLCPGPYLLKRMPTYPWQVRLTRATVGTPAHLADEFGPGIKAAVDLSQLVPHQNGGGLVARTATVADTAYVGPDALVLDNAKVLDHASIEGFAMVKGNAVVKDHARLYGNAVAQGKTVVGGYSRYHVPVVTFIQADVMADNPLIPRYGEAKLRTDGLWANYAMMDTDRRILHDYYRYAEVNTEANIPAYPNLNGYVFGEPQVVAYDGGSDEVAAGLQFNGKDQYATLHAAVMDIPEATIVTKLMVEPGVAGTVFDFGVDQANCMTLAIAADGTLTLNATVSGRPIFSLTGNRKIAGDRPVSLRVVVDGKKTALWMDADKIAETQTGFRCCDIFPPDAIRKNLIASSRDGSNRLKALFDSVVVYAKAHDRLDAEPVMDAPPIVGDNVLKRLAQKQDPERQKEFMESAKRVEEFYRLGSPRVHKQAWWREEMGNYKELYAKNILLKRWYELSRRDATYRKWDDEILPGIEAEAKTPAGQTEEAKKRHVELRRQFKEEIQPRVFSNYPHEARAIESLLSGLYRTHWNISYFNYLQRNYYPRLLGADREDLKLLTEQNKLAKDGTGWIRSADITVPLPKNKEGVIWSREGILSGAYDTLPPSLRQWYLHTQGPIEK